MKLTVEQEKWLQALESGEYKQGSGALVKDNCFCCLGVACELFIPETKTFDGIYVQYGTTNDSYHGVAPYSVVDLLNLNSQNGEIKYSEIGGVDSLAELNDRGSNFASIAAFIRANPEKVFTKGAE